MKQQAPPKSRNRNVICGEGTQWLAFTTSSGKSNITQPESAENMAVMRKKSERFIFMLVILMA
jgi:hypothetical protein